MVPIIPDARTLLWNGNESYQYYPLRTHRLDDEKYGDQTKKKGPGRMGT